MKMEHRFVWKRPPVWIICAHLLLALVGVATDTYEIFQQTRPMKTPPGSVLLFFWVLSMSSSFHCAQSITEKLLIPRLDFRFSGFLIFILSLLVGFVAILLVGGFFIEFLLPH